MTEDDNANAVLIETVDLPEMERCTYCGSPTIPAGTCSLCPNCGETSGCS